MAPLTKWTTQLMLSYATTKLGVEKPCHDAPNSVNQLSATAGPSVSAISWGFNRMDVYGNDGKGNITHQYWDGYQWGPAYNQVEALGGGFSSPPTAVSPGTGKMEIFSIGNDKTLMHKYYDGSVWGPSETTFESLGGTLDENHVLAATANGANPLDVFGKGTDGSIYLKYWDGSSWQPQDDTMEDLGDGTNFVYGPAAVSWGPKRTDVFAIATSLTMLHQYWDGTTWLSQWESLGDSEFADTPTAVSWGANRLDIFGIEMKSGALLHNVWDGSQWSKWENLGTPSDDIEFTGTVAATSWSTNRIDIVALGTDGAYYYKYWDGSQWQPSETGFISKDGSFSSSPAVVSWGENRLDIYGVGSDSMLKHLTWYGSGWYPADGTWETLAGPLEAFQH
ncbi:MAG: hypothetical protein Q9175_004569 [Cornicularia normoerica]